MNATADRLLYVPTNRESCHAIRAYLYEAHHLDEIAPRAAFALVESNEDTHVTQHAGLLTAAKRENRFPLIHFHVSLQRRFLVAVVRGAGLEGPEADWVLARLLPSGTNYGAGPNKAALLACALGAGSLHRRDSDTTPQVHRGNPLFPADVESRLLGRSMQEADEPLGSTQSPERILCVATDYDGDPALDRVEFGALSPELLIEHERLEHPYESVVGLQARVDRKFLRRDQTAYSSDVIELDKTGRGEMGACAIAEVFRHLPEMPIGETLGSDYFQKNLLYRLGLPVVYHNRRVRHSHAGFRNLKEDGQFVEYSLRDARFKLLKHTWRTHNAQLSNSVSHGPHEAFNDRFVSAWYAASLEEAVLRTPWNEQRQI